MITVLFPLTSVSGFSQHTGICFDFQRRPDTDGELSRWIFSGRCALVVLTHKKMMSRSKRSFFIVLASRSNLLSRLRETDVTIQHYANDLPSLQWLASFLTSSDDL